MRQVAPDRWIDEQLFETDGILRLLNSRDPREQPSVHCSKHEVALRLPATAIPVLAQRSIAVDDLIAQARARRLLGDLDHHVIMSGLRQNAKHGRERDLPDEEVPIGIFDEFDETLDHRALQVLWNSSHV